MTEHRTCLQKYIEVCGHEEGCVRAEWPSGMKPCTCSPSLDMLVAAGRGRLRKEHEWWNDGGAHYPSLMQHCSCGERREGSWAEVMRCHRGPCYSPVDDAERWQMLRQIVAGIDPISEPEWWSRFLAAIVDVDQEELDRLWIALHDAGLLR